jgi:hypothetical protein
MIDWTMFEDGYVRLPEGQRKSLKLTGWQQGACFDQPGLRFDVSEEDGRKVRKVFTTTSRQLIQELKPIIQKAEEQGQTEIPVSILKLGQKHHTFYDVKDDIPAQMD